MGKPSLLPSILSLPLAPAPRFFDDGSRIPIDQDAPKSRPSHQIIAYAAHLRGISAQEPCEPCRKNTRKFAECILLKGYMKNKCTNCHYTTATRWCDAKAPPETIGHIIQQVSVWDHELPDSHRSQAEDPPSVSVRSCRGLKRPHTPETPLQRQAPGTPPPPYSFLDPLLRSTSVQHPLQSTPHPPPRVIPETPQPEAQTSSAPRSEISETPQLGSSSPSPTSLTWVTVERPTSQSGDEELVAELSGDLDGNMDWEPATASPILQTPRNTAVMIPHVALWLASDFERSRDPQLSYEDDDADIDSDILLDDTPASAGSTLSQEREFCQGAAMDLLSEKEDYLLDCRLSILDARRAREMQQTLDRAKVAQELLATRCQTYSRVGRGLTSSMCHALSPALYRQIDVIDLVCDHIARERDQLLASGKEDVTYLTKRCAYLRGEEEKLDKALCRIINKGQVQQGLSERGPRKAYGVRYKWVYEVWHGIFIERGQAWQRKIAELEKRRIVEEWDPNERIIIEHAFDELIMPIMAWNNGKRISSIEMSRVRSSWGL
jgi:hypothetical protein